MNTRQRQRIFDNYGGKCHICGFPITGDQYDLDHMVPQNLEGTDDHTNLAPAHVRCNRRKQDRVAHVEPRKQYYLHADFASGTPEPSQVAFTKADYGHWLRDQIRKGKTDATLATRFYHWLNDTLRKETSYVESMALFLSCCEAEHIQGTIINDDVVYGITSPGAPR